MKITKVTNIAWAYDYPDFWNDLCNKTLKKQAEILGIAYETYAEMNDEEKEDWAFDVYRRNPSIVDEICELPTEIDLPDGDWTEELITNYLCDEYGFFVYGYALPEID